MCTGVSPSEAEYEAVTLSAGSYRRTRAESTRIPPSFIFPLASGVASTSLVLCLAPSFFAGAEGVLREMLLVEAYWESYVPSPSSRCMRTTPRVRLAFLLCKALSSSTHLTFPHRLFT